MKTTLLLVLLPGLIATTAGAVENLPVRGDVVLSGDLRLALRDGGLDPDFSVNYPG